ncbi:MAG: hypothetical protein IT428_13040 [Planctomycetaceae bacterium]|nr:hypothetical protein [Planctomycetaceae bacterium]
MIRFLCSTALVAAVLLSGLSTSAQEKSTSTGKGEGKSTGRITLTAAKAAPAKGPLVLGTPTDPHAPTMRLVVSNANELMSDFQATMKLCSPADFKQWPELEKYLDVFLIGVDRTLPARLDTITTHPIDRYVLSVPVPSDTMLTRFRRENLDPLGITATRQAGQLWKLTNAFTGFMRVKEGYASIAEYKDDIPLQMPNPIGQVANLLAMKADVVFEGTNVDNVAGALESRRASYGIRRKDALAKLKKKDNETADEFAIRKEIASANADEAERLYVEAKLALMAATIDSPQHQGRLTLQTIPLANTAFEASVKRIHEKLDRFAAIEPFGNPILSGRINLPLDEMRIAYIQKITAAMKTRSLNQIEAEKDRSADEKAVAKKIVELFYAMVDDGAKSELLNGFVESRSNASGKNTLIWGVVPKDGNVVVEMLELLPKSGKGNSAELNVDSEGDVKIHKMMMPAGVRADAKSFFGEETAYVGTSKDSLWLAIGEDGLKDLKGAIKKSAEAKDADPKAPFLNGMIKLGPWTELLHKRWGTTGNVKVRERAVAAFKGGDDILTIQMTRDEEKIDGMIKLMPGVLRFIGSSMAEFTRNLDKK